MRVVQHSKNVLNTVRAVMSCGPYADFLDTHQLQLQHSKLPESLWRRLYEVVYEACLRVRLLVPACDSEDVLCAQKLSHQTFDASEAFTFCHDTLSDPQWTVICLTVHALASSGADSPVMPPHQ